MAELYGSYMLGSVTVAYVSKMLYNYTTNTPVENINENIEEFEDIEDIEDTEDTEDIEDTEDTEELFKCIVCSEEKSLDCFSKNQQKKKKQGEWKCKVCTKI